MSSPAPLLVGACMLAGACGLVREPTPGSAPYSQPATLCAVGVVRRVIGAEPAAHVTS